MSERKRPAYQNTEAYRSLDRGLDTDYAITAEGPMFAKSVTTVVHQNRRASVRMVDRRCTVRTAPSLRVGARINFRGASVNSV